MGFDAQVFELPKDVEHPEENQDAWAFDGRRGVAAIADGVASSLFARPWARILTEAVVAELPDPDDCEAFGDWLARRRECWSSRIDVSKLAWFQKAKLRDGAFSTLLWLTLGADPADASTVRLRARAVGDSCLFLVREGKTLCTFPVDSAAQLEADPIALGSLDRHRDELIRFERIEAECRPGDLVVLATDAVADWALRQQESGSPVNWETYWNLPETTWQEEVAAFRSQRQMRYDDATMILLRVQSDSDETLPPIAIATQARCVGPTPPLQVHATSQ